MHELSDRHHKVSLTLILTNTQIILSNMQSYENDKKVCLVSSTQIQDYVHFCTCEENEILLVQRIKEQALNSFFPLLVEMKAKFNYQQNFKLKIRIKAKTNKKAFDLN